MKWVKLRGSVLVQTSRKGEIPSVPCTINHVSVSVCVSVCMRACVCSPGVVCFLDMSAPAALHGNLNSIFPLLAEHDLRLLKDTHTPRKSHYVHFLGLPGFTVVGGFHLSYLFYLLGGVVEVFLLPLGH